MYPDDENSNPFSSHSYSPPGTLTSPATTVPFSSSHVQPRSGSTARPDCESLHNFSHFQSTGEAAGSPPGFPQPLLGTPVTPFLSKTYDLVDDPFLDSTISWSSNGVSFVVWDPVEFARTILPKTFKHSNFSSFVRQLNTYGFRKVDADKWEFANEGFCKGKKHLLKNIQRRKSSTGSSTSGEVVGKDALEVEVERLRKDRSLMMGQVIELQGQQFGTVRHMNRVGEKLLEAEKKHKKMVSFLSNMFRNLPLSPRLKQMKHQKRVTCPRTLRNFAKHKGYETDTPGDQIDDFFQFPTQDTDWETLDEQFLSHREEHQAFGDQILKDENVISPLDGLYLSNGLEHIVKDEEGDLWPTDLDIGFGNCAPELLRGNYDMQQIGPSSEIQDLWGELGLLF